MMWVAIKDGVFLFGASFGSILLGGAAGFIEKSDFLLYLNLGTLKVDCSFLLSSFFLVPQSELNTPRKTYSYSYFSIHLALYQH
jgi:hypothetical protein